MRLDKILVQQGLASSRTQAQNLIRGGCVFRKLGNDWQTLTKSSEDCEPDTQLRVQPSDEMAYVSRAGLKLAGAFKHLSFSPKGCFALDVGQSTGGFSDCLLQAGATKVIGVDVGHGQLASALADHPQLISLEGINARDLSREHLQPHLRDAYFDVIVMDVSFISQTLILPQLKDLLAPDGLLVSLVKPQFEVGPQAIGKGGIVREARHLVAAEERVVECASGLGFHIRDYFDSPICGTDGNREFFLAASLNSSR